MYLNVLPRWSGSIRRHALVGVGIALLEEVYHLGSGFEVLYAQLKLCPVWNIGCYLFLEVQNVELPDPSPEHVCLRVALLSTMRIMD